MKQNSGQSSFFTKDRAFYTTLFKMLIVVAGQNLVAYSVNMADNIMLGSYSQSALSGVTIVNQIFFVVQQTAIGVSGGLVTLASQYWGENHTDPIRSLTGTALKFGLICSALCTAVCLIFPGRLLGLFTSDEEILAQAAGYLSITRWTFIIFTVSTVLMAALRSVGTVKISFYVSVVSLFVNIAINYTLIFGRFGFPEMGARGAAVGTLTARILELLIVIAFLAKGDKKLKLISRGLFTPIRGLRNDYARVAAPIMLSQVLWAVSVPIQTAILGHLSTDAIAANSVASTFYQYMKVIVTAMSSVSGVMIGNAIGRGDIERVKSDGRSLSVIDVIIGAVLACILFFCRRPLLSFYSLSDTATELALDLIAVMSVVMLFMSYQMPVSSGVVQGGGDVKFGTAVNLISMWCITMPLSFIAAFVLKLPVTAVVLCIQSDQIFKCIPIFIRFRSYKWIHRLTVDRDVV